MHLRRVMTCVVSTYKDQIGISVILDAIRACTTTILRFVLLER